MTNLKIISSGKNDHSIWIKALAFSMPSIGLALIQLPIAAVLGGVYAKDFGLALTNIASVMLIARVFDAVTDPIVGYYSDRWRVRTGSRKSFVSVGVFLLVPCSYFLFVPGEKVSTSYFTFWYLAFYLALTLFYTPYLAWINEFTRNTKEKTLVFSANSTAGQLGGAIFYLIPLLPFFARTEITPKTLQVAAILAAALLVSGLFFTLKVVPDGPCPTVPLAKDEKKAPLLLRIVALMQSMFKNKPFVLFVVAFMFLGVGIGMWVGIFFCM